MADITPPIGELNMMGYAKLGQNVRGIQTRLYARAFIFASPEDPKTRVVYISADTSASSPRIKSLALSLISSRLPNAPNLYTTSNLLISATHTHSGTGGYNDDFLYQVTSFGVYKGVREAIAEGVAEAVVKAHWDLEGGGVSDVLLAVGKVTDASVNRSPRAYMLNPPEERAQYEANVDQSFPVISIRPRLQTPANKTDDNDPILKGVMSFFAVHATSMDNTNELLSGDNKGVASLLWEEREKRRGLRSGFVAAFGQSNAGDVSPNVQGPRCVDTGLPCDGLKGSCGGKLEKCVARGPGYETGGIRLATRIIAERQYHAALAASLSPTQYSLQGTKIHHRHAWINMASIKLSPTQRTCKPAMGQSFAAGTTDGMVGIAAPNSTANPLLTFVRDLVFTRPSEELMGCHAPKPVLLPTGEVEVPYLWQPEVMPLQVFVVGRGLAFIGFPSEITTMAGRRVRKAVWEVLVRDGVLDPEGVVVLAGLSNSYASYSWMSPHPIRVDGAVGPAVTFGFSIQLEPSTSIKKAKKTTTNKRIVTNQSLPPPHIVKCTTYEEYQFQAYEGASTIFGPHTLDAYIKMFRQMAGSIADPGKMVPAGTPPPRNNDISTESPVVFDAPVIGKSYGEITVQPPRTVRLRQTISAQYVCSHPRNGVGSLKAGLEGGETFMRVERLVGAGTYRLKGYGSAKGFFGGFTDVLAVSDSFEVVV
ncbi:hypothetical protein HDU67_004624 [Dinochytrium kinnereticum]|nr:hypothetical protein HDU67_004624 [Dinochytrium kinnereticum]